MADYPEPTTLTTFSQPKQRQMQQSVQRSSRISRQTLAAQERRTPLQRAASAAKSASRQSYQPQAIAATRAEQRSCHLCWSRAVDATRTPRDSGSASTTQPGSSASVAIAGVEPREERSLGAWEEQSSTAPKDEGLSRRIKQVADKFPDVFEETTGMPPERGTEHKIELEEGAKPPFSP